MLWPPPLPLIPFCKESKSYKNINKNVRTCLLFTEICFFCGGGVIFFFFCKEKIDIQRKRKINWALLNPELLYGSWALVSL